MGPCLQDRFSSTALAWYAVKIYPNVPWPLVGVNTRRHAQRAKEEMQSFCSLEEMAKRHIFLLGHSISLNYDRRDIWMFLCWVHFGSFWCEFTGGAKKQRFLQEVQGRQNCFSFAFEWKSTRNVQAPEYSLYFHSTVIIVLTMWFQKPVGSFSSSSHWWGLVWCIRIYRNSVLNL